MPDGRAFFAGLADALERRQVACYLGAIAAGVTAGVFAPQSFSGIAGLITPFLAALLYVTFLQVPVADLPRAVRDGRFLGVVVALNFVVVPLVVAALFALVPAEHAVQIGVLLVLLCPCVDYVIVFTGLAGGDDRRLLAVTPVLLLLQMGMLPLYLWAFLGRDLSGIVAAAPFLEAFAVLIVVPLLLAWATQWLARRTRAGRSVEAAATTTMVPLMMLVLFTVIASQVPQLDGRLSGLGAVAGVYVLFVAVMTAAGIAVGAAARLGIGRRRAVVFSGVTRNSLVVLPLALALPPALAPTAAAVVVLQTLIELLAMVLLVRLVSRMTHAPVGPAPTSGGPPG